MGKIPIFSLSAAVNGKNCWLFAELSGISMLISSKFCTFASENVWSSCNLLPLRERETFEEMVLKNSENLRVGLGIE